MSTPGTFRESPADSSPENENEGGDTIGNDSGGDEHKKSEPPASRKRKRTYVLTAMLVAAITGGTAAAVALNSGDEPSDEKDSLAIATAPITRGDVVDTESVDGKLTYADQRTVPAASAGVVTWLPSEGRTISRGKPLYKVDNKPVTLLYGPLPLYRTLKDGVEGPDVEQLERNLDVLGYGDDLSVDDEFTYATADAVESWQEDLGLKETGTVDAGQVVFESGEVRINDVMVAKGDRIGAGAKALTVTDTNPTVHVDLDAAKQSLVKKGETVGIELPGGTTVKGKITDVGTVAETKDDKSTIDVDISLSTKDVGNVDQAPVTVELESERAENVLSVPIEALLGLREGGFGVEVVTGEETRIVPIETGTYGGGRVEVTGQGLREGMKVGVPRS